MASDFIVESNEPVRDRCLKPGYAFKLNKREGGSIYPFFYLPKGGDDPETTVPEYCVVSSEALPAKGIRMYDVFVFHGPWLEENHNPHWVHKGKVPSNSAIIESIPDVEFALIKDRLDHWTHKSQAFDGSGYKELLPQEQL